MPQTFRYSKGDVRIAFLLGLCLFFLAALQLNGGQNLANDAGAYMNTALAISQGRMEEQDRLKKPVQKKCILLHGTFFTTLRNACVWR